MQYLEIEKLEEISREEFEAVKPYPFVNMPGLLTEHGFQSLLATMPNLSVFDHSVGKERPGGQVPHDRYSLEYASETRVPEPWKEFIGELCSDRYRNTIARLMSANRVRLRFHWHYTPGGGAVSPHVDSPREHGSHLFFFNSEDDWDPGWGGNTLILDDGERLGVNSAPALEDFDREIACNSIGNYSAIIKRSDHAWHALRPINSPEGEFRRLFAVVVIPNTYYWKIRDRIIGKRKHAY